MRRTFLVTSLLAAVLAFGSLPAMAGVSADVNVRVGHRGEVYDSRAPRGDWQNSSGYGYAGGQWSNNGCSSNGDRQFRGSTWDGHDQWDSSGRWGRGHGHGKHGNSFRGNGSWNRDRSGGDRDNSRGYDRNDGYDRNGY